MNLKKTSSPWRADACISLTSDPHILFFIWLLTNIACMMQHDVNHGLSFQPIFTYISLPYFTTPLIHLYTYYTWYDQWHTNKVMLVFHMRIRTCEFSVCFRVSVFVTEFLEIRLTRVPFLRPSFQRMRSPAHQTSVSVVRFRTGDCWRQGRSAVVVVMPARWARLLPRRIRLHYIILVFHNATYTWSDQMCIRCMISDELAIWSCSTDGVSDADRHLIRLSGDLYLNKSIVRMVICEGVPNFKSRERTGPNDCLPAASDVIQISIVQFSNMMQQSKRRCWSGGW